MEFGTDARRKRAAAYKEELDSWEDSERLKLRDFWECLKDLNLDLIDAAVGMRHTGLFKEEEHRLALALNANYALELRQGIQVTR